MDGTRPVKPSGRKDRPFDLAEIARHEKWGDYTAASTTKDETAQKVKVILLLAQFQVVVGVWYMAYPNGCQHALHIC